MKLLRSLLALLVALSLSAASGHADSVVTDWNDAFLQAVRTVKFGPPQTARAGAILHTCIFDAWACYDANAVGTQYFGYLRRPAIERTDANKKLAISYAAYRALVDLFPTQQTAFAAVFSLQTNGADPANFSTDITTPAGIGNVVATAVIFERHYDGANQLGDLHAGSYSDYTGYVPLNAPHDPAAPGETIASPDHWQPIVFHLPNLTTATPGFLVPHWQNVTPFALKFAGQFRPIPPATRSVNPVLYREQAEYIIRVTANLNDRRKTIVEYWADGPASETPPGHWNLHAKFVSHRDGYGVNKDAKLFFVLNNALLDASIATWECKRFYDYVRPITAIHLLKRDKMIPIFDGGMVLGQNWKPFQPDSFLTPPFPEYSSGHSCFSSAAAFILHTFTGSDAFGSSVTLPVGSSKIQPGTVPAAAVTLSWPTFTSAANEAAVSRRYGGIHFPQGDIASRVLGVQVGATTWAKAHKFIRGTANPGD